MRIFLMLSLLAIFMWSGCDSFDGDNKKVGHRRIMSGADLHNEGGYGRDGSNSDDSGDNEDAGDSTGGCEDDDGGDDVPQCDEQAALAAFKTNLQPSIDKSCNLCHAFAAGGLTMKKKEDDAVVVTQNRINLKASTESVSAERLFLKISNQSAVGHGGGDQSDPEKGNLTLAKIEAWLAAEVGCD